MPYIQELGLYFTTRLETQSRAFIKYNNIYNTFTIH